MADHIEAGGSKPKLHEISFHVSVKATTNVNGLEPEIVMAYLLHHADMCGARDPANRKRFLTAARELATIYSYMPMAERVKASPDVVPDGHHS